nr:aspartyl-phosphate phosphatase Spo0E family protein [Priestia megaterium]MDH3183518.1 aspartyl-phosphate phosphatase Spo0E family protein [Priestia megaterium]MDH3183690.1 aspartyl-phosphate phosphatase Spo0E family protein [Priestia megaterium]MDH3183695.1 aspartyl-phosphate phosphatase Spo0E family protein [Priestia megaterium]
MTWYNGLIINALLVEIEIKREKMIQIALEEGFTSDNTIKASQFIDILLNELHRINTSTLLCVSV